MLEAISKLKLKNSKNHFSILVLYLPAYSIQAYETTFETTCKTSCAVTSRLLSNTRALVFLLLQWNLNTCIRVKFEGVG